MITITEKKIAGLEPRWAPYAGFSLLFDNPGASLLRVGDLWKVACSPEAGRELDLYFRLADTLRELDCDLLLRTYLFCALPSASYHVTVWDGVNVRNISSVRPDICPGWSTFLAGIPGSLRTPPASMAVVTGSTLMERSFGSLRFRFDELALWGNKVLVARLQPADEASEAIFVDLCARRKELCAAAQEQLGISPSQDYFPHVSLGYFANQDAGQSAYGALDDWKERFHKNLASSTIAFATLAAYAFTDMTSFFKLA